MELSHGEESSSAGLSGGLASDEEWSAQESTRVSFWLLLLPVQFE